MGQSGITVPLVLATLAALAAIVALTVVGWIVAGSLNDQAQGNEHAEVMGAALEVSRTSASLAAAGSVESNATMTRESVIASRNAIAAHKTELASQLALLEGKGHDGRVTRINEQVDLLAANVDQIENGRPDILRALLTGAQNHRSLGQSTTRELLPAVAGSMDNQRYFMLTGRSDLRERVATGAEAFSPEEFERFTRMSTLLGSIGIAHSSLVAASRLVQPTLVTTVEEAFESATQRMDKSIEYLSENGGPELDPRVIPLSQRLMESGTGQGNYFDALKARLSMSVRERELIAANERILAGLQTEIQALSQEVQQSAAASKDQSAQTASTGRMIVLIVGIVGAVIAVVALGYLFFRGREA